MRNFGPCLCGDPYCGSCGPAQGNYKCPMCGKWSADGGCDNPEECDEEVRRMDEEMAKAEEKWIDEVAAMPPNTWDILKDQGE